MSKQQDSTVWLDAGTIDELPRPGARQLRTPQGNIALFRTGSDAIHAVADACPHRGGPLSQGMVYGERVHCAMHGLNLDLASGIAVAPDCGCAPVYPVRLEGRRIFVGMSSEVREGAGCACAALA